MERALTHIRAREYEQALAIWRRLAAENPHDYEARVWVARLLSWQGQQSAAEEVYRGVLREAPNNLAAALGLVDVVSWQGRTGEAKSHLRRLQAQHRSNPEVLLRLGRISRWQGQRQEALSYYQEVLRVDPANEEARTALEVLQAQTRYRIAVGYFLEEFDFVRNTHGNFVEFLYHDHRRLWLRGRFQYQNKFFENNTRYIVGATYRFGEATYLRGEFGWAAAGDRVIPNQDYMVELTQGLGGSVAVGGGYRLLNFHDAEAQVLTARFSRDFRSDLHLEVHYTPARTRFAATASRVWNHGGWTRLVWEANRRVSPYVLYAVGAENFATADRLGRFSAQTYGVGAEVHITPSQGLRLSYHFQNRTQGSREQGFGISYFFGF
ncbi:MAG: tetratricopeptide repeat protein [Terriglobia bacterium]